MLRQCNILFNKSYNLHELMLDRFQFENNPSILKLRSDGKNLLIHFINIGLVMIDLFCKN